MRVRILSALVMSLLVLVMVGCGGGGGGGGSTVQSGPVLSGTASKGPVAGGTVKAFRIISSARYDNTPLAQATTAADGSYSLGLPVGFSKGSVMVQITGGSYKDEATGSTVQLSSEYPNGMRAVFGNISGMVKRGEKIEYAITPFTELATEDAGTSLGDDSIHASNGKVAAAFGLPDIVKSKPADASSAFPAGTSDDSKKYALGLATLSQYKKDFGQGATLASISAGLLAQLSGGGLSLQTQNQLEASANNFTGGTQNSNPILQTPAGNPSAPTGIQTTPAAATSISIGSSQTITASVVKTGGGSVPDGTLVSFSTSFGTLSATSAATAGGVATVSLSSASVGNAVVTASCGSVSSQAGTISFVDPNAPAGMTLTPSAATGITNGAAVVLSANVTRAAGGPVPDGTVVSFSIASGSGTLSGATTTSGGVATVNLTSSVAGASVSVRASAGTVVKTASVAFISQPTQAIVKVSTTRAQASPLIGGVSATVSYATNKGLGITAGAVAASGAGTGSTLVANANNSGQVILGLINTSGIQLGEFATLTFQIQAGNFPTAADFSIAAGSNAIDVNTVAIPGVSASILSVTIQ